MLDAHSACQERHVFVINDDAKRRVIALEAAAYSVGRDPSNAIVLDTDTISRQHAILLRVPIPGTKYYRYRVIDGNSQGKPSANGVFVNGQKGRTQDLKNGDVIRFGQSIEASYLTVSMGDAEFAHYLESISYQSIKSDTINAKETLVAASFMEDEPMTTVTVAQSKTATPAKTSAIPWAETLHEEKSAALVRSHRPSAKVMGLGLVAAVVGVAGIWMLGSHSRSAQSSAESIHSVETPTPKP